MVAIKWDRCCHVNVHGVQIEHSAELSQFSGTGEDSASGQCRKSSLVRGKRKMSSRKREQ